MKFSYNWLQSFFNKRLPKPKKLAELLTLHSFEVTGIEKKGRDFVLDIDVLPNRAHDCFSHQGIAQEIAVITSYKLQATSYKFKEAPKLKSGDFVKIGVRDKTACPRYTLKVVGDVKVIASPKWLQERLMACGLRPINNIVDIANYVMLETGQPLHAFDFDKLASLNNKKIIVRFANKGERIVTLDEKRYELDSEVLIIADEKSPIAIAGIKGGKIPEVTRATKTIVLESANFNPLVIRRGSRKLNLRTDASLRFEQGIDPNLTEIAINRASFLIQELAGGKAYQGLADFYPRKVLPRTIKLDSAYVKNLLGTELTDREIKKILEKLGFKVSIVRSPAFAKASAFALRASADKSAGGQMLIGVPTGRPDIELAEDLVEEIGRVYGYQKLEPKLPLAALILPKRNWETFWGNSIRDSLKEVGFTEVYSYSFLSEKQAEIFGSASSPQVGKEDLIEIENPVSAEQTYLRASLISNLLKNVADNQRDFPEIRTFEIGKTFKKFKVTVQNPKLVEKMMLTGLITGDAFYQLKGVIDLLLNRLGISGVWYDEYEPTPEESKIDIWHPKRCAEIKIDNEETGFLGEISPKILEKLKIKGKVNVFDINFEKLIQLTSEEQEYQPPSKYPFAVRDLAILVPGDVKVEEVLNRIEITGGALLKDIDLFDMYDGKELPEGKKNFAFHLIFQAEDRTLSSKEIDNIMKKIIKAIEKESEWEVRR